jgi:hypothetical protein
MQVNSEKRKVKSGGRREGVWRGVWIVCGMMLGAAAACGEGWVSPSHCWDNRTDAPTTKLSDLGEVRFLSPTRVATLDEKLTERLAQVRSKMDFSSVPGNVRLKKEPIPATLVEAANYLDNHVCMAYPPILCVEADDAFFFSGGRSTGPVYDFESGMAIMKADGSLWTWDGRLETSEK